jgi:hypothetical protein
VRPELLDIHHKLTGAVRPTYNPNAFTLARLASIDLESVEKPIKTLASTIRDKQIPDLVAALTSEEMFRRVVDVSELLH